jgi:hypothetical protein
VTLKNTYNARARTQGLGYIWQVLYHWATSPALRVFLISQIRSFFGLITPITFPWSLVPSVIVIFVHCPLPLHWKLLNCLLQRCSINLVKWMWKLPHLIFIIEESYFIPILQMAKLRCTSYLTSPGSHGEFLNTLWKLSAVDQYI